MDKKELELAGIDVESLLKRLMQNEAILPVFVKKFLENTTYDELKQAIEAGDMEEATAKSHSLKGMCVNLSLVELGQLFQKQLEYFRAGEFENAIAMTDTIDKVYANAIEHMGLWVK